MHSTFRQAYPQSAPGASKARRDVGQFAALCEMASDQVSDVVLSVGEAISNIVEHSGSTHDFSLCCDFDGQRLVIWIEDQGKGFMPSAVVHHIEPMETRGLGIFLMNSLMDKVEVSMKPGDGAILQLEKLAAGAAGRRTAKTRPARHESP